MVVGGCGDYFDVADTVIMMEAYVPSDATLRAKAVAEELPSTLPEGDAAVFHKVRVAARVFRDGADERLRFVLRERCPVQTRMLPAPWPLQPPGTGDSESSASERAGRRPGKKVSGKSPGQAKLRMGPRASGPRLRGTADGNWPN